MMKLDTARLSPRNLLADAELVGFAWSGGMSIMKANLAKSGKGPVGYLKASLDRAEIAAAS